MSTALSAANLRLKLGQWATAAAAYRRVLQAAGGDSADASMRGVAGMVPSEAEAGMARGKLREAEEGLRRQQAEAMRPSPSPSPTSTLPPSPTSNPTPKPDPNPNPDPKQAEAMSPIERRGRPRAIAWYASATPNSLYLLTTTEAQHSLQPALALVLLLAHGTYGTYYTCEVRVAA